MFFELRQYRLKPGQRERWVKLMEEVIVPYQQSKGMVIVGNFTAPQEDDLYIWIRRFESEEERERLYKAVYDTDYWRSLKPQLDEILDRERMVITRLEPTPRSIIR